MERVEVRRLQHHVQSRAPDPSGVHRHFDVSSTDDSGRLQQERQTPTAANAGNAMPLLYQCRRKPVDIAQSRVNRLAASGHINWLVRDAGW